MVFPYDRFMFTVITVYSHWTTSFAFCQFRRCILSDSPCVQSVQMSLVLHFGFAIIHTHILYIYIYTHNVYIYIYTYMYNSFSNRRLFPDHVLN